MESSAALEKIETSPAHASPGKDKWLIAIGVFKLLKATLFFLLGVGALRLLHKDLVDEVTRWIISLRFDPEGRFVSLILDKVAMIDPHRLRQISAAVFAYSGLCIIEGAGLVLQKVWAEYVTLVLTASFLPWEVFEIFHHITWIKVGLLSINLLVLAYLFSVVQANIRHRNANGVG